LKKIKERKKERKRKGASRLQPPLCAVRAGQRIKLVFYIGEEERNKQEKRKRTPTIPKNPLQFKEFYAIIKPDNLYHKEQ